MVRDRTKLGLNDITNLKCRKVKTENVVINPVFLNRSYYKGIVLRKKRMYPKACFAHCCHSVTTTCTCPCLLVLGIIMVRVLFMYVLSALKLRLGVVKINFTLPRTRTYDSRVIHQAL